MTTPIPATSTGSATMASPATAAGTSDRVRRNDDLGKDAFLKLMVAQLRYQDPLSPADPQSFLAQTAQFTTVEKLDALTKQGESTSLALGLSAAGSMIGRTVTWQATDGSTPNGRVDAAVTTPDGIAVRIGDQTVPLSAIQNVR